MGNDMKNSLRQGCRAPPAARPTFGFMIVTYHKHNRLNPRSSFVRHSPHVSDESFKRP
jgi:hypothetical protein